MNLIFVSDSLTKGKSIALGHNQIMILMLGGLLLSVSIAFGMHYFMLSPDGVPSQQNRAQNRADFQEDLNAMAARLGQLQAQSFRLDALGGRLAKHFNLPEKEFDFSKKPGQGGAEASMAQYQLNPQQLEHELAQFAEQLDARTDGLSILEALTLREQVKQGAFPSRYPVTTGWFSSNYGWRLDPFSGKQAMHEGVDFVAEAGTPIKAAAGGVVVYSDYHAQYGNMISVDHGSGLISRYAHASKRLVKMGDMVLQGQIIGEVGSTGRSTGAHLHFEVLSNGAPQNPVRYLHNPG